MGIKTSLTSGVIIAVGVLSGCIQSTLDPTLLSRYQRTIARSGPQQRLADNIVRQAPGTTGPPLRTSTDPETGRTRVHLTLTEAVGRALQNNTSIKVVGYDPAVAREDVIIAEAEFDPIFNAEFDYTRNKSPITNISALKRTTTTTFQTSLAKKFANGAEARLSHQVVRQSATSTSSVFDPSYTNRLAVELTQPLLRDFGPKVNLAQIRVSRINEKISLDSFRSTVLDVIAQTQNLYWNLYGAQRQYEIRRILVERSETTLAQVRARKDLDASQVQITDAEATLATNKLSLIRAERQIGDARDQLIRIMADASITLLDDFDIFLETPLSTAPLIIDAPDQVATALKYSPELAQARKAIQIQDISVTVAENQVLPRLDLIQGVGVNGVQGHFEDSWQQMWGADYVNTNIALSFEWPIANRARRANLRKARFNRSKSVATLQDTADEVALNVNDAVRQIDFNYDLVVSGRESLQANQKNLKALETRRKFRQALTPDFLNRLLNQQTNVAQAEFDLLAAEVSYNIAQATLARVTGTALDDMGVLVADTEPDTVDLVLSRTALTGDLEKEIPTPPPGAGAATQPADPANN